MTIKLADMPATDLIQALVLSFYSYNEDISQHFWLMEAMQLWFYGRCQFATRTNLSTSFGK